MNYISSKILKEINSHLNCGNPANLPIIYIFDKNAIEVKALVPKEEIRDYTLFIEERNGDHLLIPLMSFNLNYKNKEDEKLRIGKMCDIIKTKVEIDELKKRLFDRFFDISILDLVDELINKFKNEEIELFIKVIERYVMK